MKYLIVTCLLIIWGNNLPAQTVSPDKPSLPVVSIPLDSMPESEINLPIQIDLKPFYEMANKGVDTLFTSAGYPNAWVQDGCTTRYKYSFRRGPLHFDFQKTTLTIHFTGYYKIIGSTRACVKGVAVSPWTPECRCGFDEGERRVNISFTITPVVLVNYLVKMQVARNEPLPLDKCSVCFWGQDITATIMESLKKELDLSKAEIEKKYGRVDFRPQFQQTWHQLNTPFNINGMGWLQINPQKVRINKLYGTGDKLNIHIGLSAKPVIKFEKPLNPLSTIPPISSFSRMPGFNIQVDAVLNYDSLSAILNKQIVGKELSFRKAFIRKQFIFQECRLLGAKNEKLIIMVKFTGTDNGFFYVTAKPVYTASTKILSLTDINFDVKSKDAILKAADWLFSQKIINEIEKQSKYDLSTFMDSTKTNMQQQLNREFAKGVKGSGSITEITIPVIQPLVNYLMVRVHANGQFSLMVHAVDFSL